MYEIIFTCTASAKGSTKCINMKDICGHQRRRMVWGNAFEKIYVGQGLRSESTSC